jgi:hypothetical protein
MRTKNLILPAIAALAVAAGSDAVFAQEMTPDQILINETLYDFYYYDLDVSFVPDGRFAFGYGAADEHGTLEQAVIGGNVYVVAAKCDSDCPDIDIAFIDGNGITITVDETDADFASVAFTPDIDQTMGIRVTPDQCYSAEPCDYGAGIFVQQIPDPQ